jgi:xanthine dehydrogenase YagS FAD-binding subunit
MQPFRYVQSTSSNEAVASASADPGAFFLGGGTSLVDLMKLGVLQPEKLIDLNKLPLAEIKEHNGGVLIGALARNSDVAHNRIVKDKYPVLSQALLSGASAQLRNMATTGGNLLQRTRCYYYRNATMPCNKREPGSGCPAVEGYNRIHAIFGGSKHCVAVNPSDMSVALAALDAIIHIEGPNGTRKVPIAKFYHLPGDHPEQETTLQQGELIVAVEVPACNFANRSTYLKVRDRTSFAFALVSAACALEVQGGVIRNARVALGGVGTVPWRSAEAEQALIGKPAKAETYKEAGKAAVAGAEALKHNGFKIELASRTVARALARLGEGA